ncbi:carboxymuconolactone decarboxylase family protein [Paraburkholderia sp.]|uniref:carboxymuconolactone decarboxylase family protein n=1 Tax=Paraburkholderia sp. TaxID=1926495 RepID=UPI003D6E4A50
MPRIPAPATIADAPAASRPLLEAVERQLGTVPNLFRLIGASPAALEGHMGLSGALGKGTLSLQTRQRVAVAIAEFNGCDYCLSAHAYLAKHLAKMDDTEIAASRDGHSSDPKAEAAVRFALAVAQQRGRVADADLDAVRAAGYDDAQIVEIVQHVALNTWTNYLNLVARTDIDFPVLHTRHAA